MANSRERKVFRTSFWLGCQDMLKDIYFDISDANTSASFYHLIFADNIIIQVKVHG